MFRSQTIVSCIFVPGLVLGLASPASAQPASAQDAPPSPATELAPLPAAEPLPPPAADPTSIPPAVARALQEVKAENQTLQERVSQLESDNESRLSSESFRLRLYGFASAILNRNWVKQGSYFDGYMPDRWSFGVSDFNLYTDARAGERWRFLGEIRFLNEPNGNQTTQGTAFVRTDTSFIDPFYGATLRWSGILIERAQIEYRMSDYLGFAVGRFLTPYGIWNVEHAATVVIPVRLPYPIMGMSIPKAQTGAQVNGRFFPAPGVQLDYAVTASNGRGPMDELWDLDDNKAVGLRLRMAWEGRRTRVAAGTYLYNGQFTSRDKTVSSSNGQLSLPSEIMVQYKEQAAALDLLIEHGPLRLQGEFIRRAIRYTDGKRELNMIRTAYVADHVQHSAYALAAFRLPINVAELRVYGMFEYDNPLDVVVKIFSGGVNWRITPAVVAKYEIYKIIMDSYIPPYTGCWGMATQLAMSF